MYELNIFCQVFFESLGERTFTFLPAQSYRVFIYVNILILLLLIFIFQETQVYEFDIVIEIYSQICCTYFYKMYIFLSPLPFSSDLEKRLEGAHGGPS